MLKKVAPKLKFWNNDLSSRKKPMDFPYKKGGFYEKNFNN
jgi:hypothetical protein